MKTAIIFDWVGTLAQSGEEERLMLDEHAEKVVEMLHGRYKLAVISKATNPRQRYQEIAQSPLNHYLVHIQACHEKTEAAVQEALRALEVQGNQCYAVDDRVRNFPAFNRLGCETIWLQQGMYAEERPQHHEEAPCRIIAHLPELIQLLV
jgi:FMN phosphatase YigB (HAD superfamily)